MLAQRAPRRIHYAWIIAAITFLMLIVTAGVRSTPSVLMIPLEQEFGWSRPIVSLAVSINIFLYGLCGPFAAALMDKLGALSTSGALRRVSSCADGHPDPQPVKQRPPRSHRSSHPSHRRPPLFVTHEPSPLLSPLRRALVPGLPAFPLVSWPGSAPGASSFVRRPKPLERV